MPPKEVSPLRLLRERAGLSLRELARRIDEQPTNLSFWERTGKLPKPEVLVPLAQALGVTVEELLGQPKARRSPAAGGKLGQLVQEVNQLPRRKQQQIIAVLEDMLLASQARKAS